MTSAQFISVVKRLKSPGVIILTFLLLEKNAIKTQPICSHHDQTNEVNHEVVLRPHNYIKESQHEFNSSSHGFPCFEFLRMLLQVMFPWELRRKIFHTGNRLKHLLAQSKQKQQQQKKFRCCSLHDYFLSHQLSSPCCYLGF